MEGNPGLIEISIQSLTGSSIDLLVSSNETIMGIKVRVQRLDDIPVNQQHLVWRDQELQNSNTLEHYGIGTMAVIKLVLSLKGGPIGTKRFQLDEPKIHEIVEYLAEVDDSVSTSSSSSSLLSDSNKSSPTKKRVTVIVQCGGSRLSFYKVLGQGAPQAISSDHKLSVSDRTTSNLLSKYDDLKKMRDRLTENGKTKDKMMLLKSQMAAKKAKKVKEDEVTEEEDETQMENIKSMKRQEGDGSENPSTYPCTYPTTYSPSKSYLNYLNQRTLLRHPNHKYLSSDFGEVTKSSDVDEDSDDHVRFLKPLRTPPDESAERLKKKTLPSLNLKPTLDYKTALFKLNRDLEVSETKDEPETIKDKSTMDFPINIPKHHKAALHQTILPPHFLTPVHSKHLKPSSSSTQPIKNSKMLKSLPPLKSPSLKSPTLKSPTLKSPTLKSPTLKSPTLKSPTLKSPTLKSPSLKSPTLKSPSLKIPPLKSPPLRTPPSRIDATTKADYWEEVEGKSWKGSGFYKHMRDCLLDFEGKDWDFIYRKMKLQNNLPYSMQHLEGEDDGDDERKMKKEGSSVNVADRISHKPPTPSQLSRKKSVSPQPEKYLKNMGKKVCRESSITELKLSSQASAIESHSKERYFKNIYPVLPPISITKQAIDTSCEPVSSDSTLSSNMSDESAISSPTFNNSTLCANFNTYTYRNLANQYDLEDDDDYVDDDDDDGDDDDDTADEDEDEDEDDDDDDGDTNDIYDKAKTLNISRTLRSPDIQNYRSQIKKFFQDKLNDNFPLISNQYRQQIRKSSNNTDAPTLPPLLPSLHKSLSNHYDLSLKTAKTQTSTIKSGNNKRCFVCRKRTPLATSFVCRCEKNFCTIHRYPESHNCSYDYKFEGRKTLKDNSPVVAASKLPKI